MGPLAVTSMRTDWNSGFVAGPHHCLGKLQGTCQVCPWCQSKNITFVSFTCLASTYISLGRHFLLAKCFENIAAEYSGEAGHPPGDLQVLSFPGHSCPPSSTPHPAMCQICTFLEVGDNGASLSPDSKVSEVLVNQAVFRSGVDNSEN